MSLNSIKNRLRHRLDRVLTHTHDHYLCCLPEHIGWVTSWMLKLFYSGIKLDSSQTDILKNIPKESTIVYVIKFKSHFEYLFFYTRYKLLRLPFPSIAFDYHIIFWQPLSRIFRVLLAHVDALLRFRRFPDPFKSGFFRRELASGTAAFLPLVEKRSFYRRFVQKKTDPVKHLIEIQHTMDRPIYLVPLLFFFSKKPNPSIPSVIDALFGPEQRPGIIRRLVTLFRTPEKIFVEISDPLNVKEFSDRAAAQEQTIDHQSLLLRRNLLRQINRHRQSITGPVLKFRQELKESILTNDRLQSFMTQYAQKRHIPIQKVHKEADDYIDEIAADYSMTVIRIGEYGIGWLLKFMYDGVIINTEKLNQIKSASKNGPVIFIPCHKSHMDYLIMSYILYHHNMPCPHIAAGKNLSFWPLGPFFRGGGAFFIRRTFKGAVLYAKVFSEYIHKLLEERFNIEVFIEGGRSRTGKLLMPKLGLLSILLNAYKNQACEDMIFAPVFIGYDRVLEESAYLNELEGGQKTPENLRQVFDARKFLKKRYGRIYIRFHDPISLNALLQEENTSIQDMSPKEFNVFCKTLGTRVLNAIDKMTVVTPHALVSSAILNASKKRFSHSQLRDHIDTYLSFLLIQGSALTDTLVQDPVHAVDHVLESYVQRKFIDRDTEDNTEDAAPEVIFTVNTAKRPLLEYYKNNCISFFIPAAFTAISILELDAFQFSSTGLHGGYLFLQNFFKNEFAWDVDRTPDIFVRKTIKAFIDDAILMPHPVLPDTYNLTSEGYRKLKFYSRFLKTFFESYWIVLHYMKQTPFNSLDAKERLKKVQALGHRMYKNEDIDLKESLSKINYQNALDFFMDQGIKGSEDAEKIQYYETVIRKYLNCVYQE